MGDWTHLDDAGRPRMVDVTEKEASLRTAVARGVVSASVDTVRRVARGEAAKGDVLAVAQVAGIMAAKRTGEWIPLCHSLALQGVEMSFELDETRGRIAVEARVRAVGPTGVEMEALTAVSAAALTIYDMCKALDRDMVLGEIRLVEKTGGRSGTYRRPGEEPS